MRTPFTFNLSIFNLLEVVVTVVTVCFLVVQCSLLVRLEQVGRHLLLVAFRDIVVLGFVCHEDDTHFDDGDAGFEFLDDLRIYVIRSESVVERDRLRTSFLRVFFLLYRRSGYAVKTESLVVCKTDQHTRFVGELIVIVDIHRFYQQCRDIFTVDTVLYKSQLRLEVLGRRAIYMNKLAAFCSVHTQRQYQRYHYRKYLFHFYYLLIINY